MGDQVHRFGVARDSERMQGGSTPAGRRAEQSALPSGGGSGMGFRTWWASSQHAPHDLWHKVQCRRGRHEFAGGHRMQLGSEFVTVERRCRWCDAPPAIC